MIRTRETTINISRICPHISPQKPTLSFVVFDADVFAGCAISNVDAGI